MKSGVMANDPLVPNRQPISRPSGYVRNPEYPAQILPLLETRGADSSASLKACEILQQPQRFGPRNRGDCGIRKGAADGVESHPSQKARRRGATTLL